MNETLNGTMRDAMRLMQTGDLRAATAAIQRGLGGGAAGLNASQVQPEPATGARGWIDTQYRVVDDLDRADPMEAPGTGPRGRTGSTHGSFESHVFTCAAGTRDYKIYVPGSSGAGPLPMVMMLHGCTQGPDDFARGTRMNALAEEHGYIVVYPAQSPGANHNKCWNWFQREHQARDRGEPAIIAELTRHIVSSRGVDSRRVFIAGMSAGGAMAKVVADAYPDLFAAVGVHSGLAAGSAHDLPSALSAMKTGRASQVASSALQVPAIVFHGDQDTTVSPGNGDAVIAQSTTRRADHAEVTGALQREVTRGAVPGGRNYTRTIYRGMDGQDIAEQWVVHGAGHAWSGGDLTGSFTDPGGPDASSEMLRFFAAHARTVVN